MFFFQIVCNFLLFLTKQVKSNRFCAAFPIQFLGAIYVVPFIQYDLCHHRLILLCNRCAPAIFSMWNVDEQHQVGTCAKSMHATLSNAYREWQMKSIRYRKWFAKSNSMWLAFSSLSMLYHCFNILRCIELHDYRSYEKHRNQFISNFLINLHISIQFFEFFQTWNFQLVLLKFNSKRLCSQSHQPAAIPHKLGSHIFNVRWNYEFSF